MTDYFNNIKLKELYALYKIIESSEGNKEYVKRQHERYGRNFPENINFLVRLGLIKESSDAYTISAAHPKTGNNEKDIKMKIVESLFENKSIYGDMLHGYLNNFELKSGKYTYKPGNRERLQYSSIRNFLIELNIVFVSGEPREYILNNRYTPYIFITLNKYDLSKFERDLEQKKNIGYESELLILDYETSRIANFPINNLAVEHTSQENVIAGYDIRSWTYDEQMGSHAARYIEVKAVSGGHPVFYWSRNEIEQSKKLSNNYYLYLLPVDVSVGLNIDKLQIIKNPFDTIFNDDEHWVVDTEVYRITNTRSNLSRNYT